MTDETRWVTMQLTQSDLDLIAATLTHRAEAAEKLWKSPHAIPAKFVERSKSMRRLVDALDAAWETGQPVTPIEP
jgi:hypothetical protein